jgi:hypothetical protein
MWLLVLLALNLNAVEIIPENQKPVIVMRGHYDSSIQNVFPPSEYRYYDKAAEREELLADGYLPPLERDALFRKLNFETKIQQLDQMDKDMLVMGARVYTAAQLKKQYPMLSLPELQRLRVEVRKIK